MVAQLTINVMCDYTRKIIIGNVNDFENDSRSVQFIATISSYLIRKVKIAVMLLLVKCYDNKMVKSPGCSSKRNAPMRLTNKKKTFASACSDLL